MFRVHVCWMAPFVLATAMFVGGCSSSSMPITVTLLPSSPQAIDQNQTVAINSAVMNDSTHKGVSWTLTGPGSLTNSNVSSVTYNPPTTNITTSQQRRHLPISMDCLRRAHCNWI
jgi:hypothetical protein